MIQLCFTVNIALLNMYQLPLNEEGLIPSPWPVRVLIVHPVALSLAHLGITGTVLTH